MRNQLKSIEISRNQKKSKGQEDAVHETEVDEIEDPLLAGVVMPQQALRTGHAAPLGFGKPTLLQKQVKRQKNSLLSPELILCIYTSVFGRV